MGYKFSGKPAGVLAVGEHYTRLDVPRFKPRGGVVQYEAYLNIGYTVRDPVLPARVRVRLVRGPWRGKPADPTGYNDIDLDPRRSETVRTLTHFELAERGRPVWWELKADNATVNIGTRYAKCTNA